MKHIPYYIFLSIALFLCTNTIAQNQEIELKQNYEELEQKYTQYKNDSILSKKYATLLLQKAKKENDIIKQADSYYRFTEISEYPKNIAYLDTIINSTKNIDNFNYPAKAFIRKAQIYGVKSQFKKSMDELVFANIYANKNKNVDQQYRIKYFIALLKEDVGESEESLIIFKKINDYYKTKIKEDESFLNQYTKSTFALGVSYDKNKKYDSAHYTTKLAINLSLKSKDSSFYDQLLLSSGITHYKKKEFKSSLDSIYKYLDIIKNKKIKNNGIEIIANLYLGKIYFEQNEYEKSLSYLINVDSTAFNSQFFFPDIRSGYETLIKTYKKQDDAEKQLFYIDRLLSVDSILDTNYKHIYSKMSKEYATPNLILEKQKIINSLQKNNQTTTSIVIVLAVLLIIVVILLIRNNKKKKGYQERFLELYDKGNTSTEVDKTTIKTKASTIASPQKQTNVYDLGISEIIVDDIIKRLEEFEQKQKFLESNITVNSLSKSFNTNSKYLSKIINAHKAKSFSNYINDHRIDFVIEKLKEDTKFRKYTIKAIANEIGFNTTEAFSKSFYKRTEIYPSYFMKQLEKKQQEQTKN